MQKINNPKKAIIGAIGALALAGAVITGASTASAAASTPTTPTTAHTTPQRLNLPQATTAPNAVSWSYRQCWSNVSNLATLQISAPVNAGQPVAVSAVELGGNGLEFVGAAQVEAQDVAVTQGSIELLINTNWGNAISVCVHYLA